MLLRAYYRRHLRLAVRRAVDRGQMHHARLLDTLIQEHDSPNPPVPPAEKPVSDV